MISFVKTEVSYINKICLFLVVTFALIFVGGVQGAESEEQSNNEITIYTSVKNLNQNQTNGSDSSIKTFDDGEFLKKETSLTERELANGTRHPKFGFSLPIPTIPGFTSGSSTNVNDPNYNSNNNQNNQNPNNNDGGNGIGTGLGVASTAVLIKSGILGGLTAIKAAIIPPLFIGAIIIFLIAGAVFFTCNVINCGFGGSNVGGAIGPGFSGLPSFNNLFNRNGYDYYEQQIQPVYQALDEGYKKFQ